MTQFIPERAYVELKRVLAILQCDPEGSLVGAVMATFMRAYRRANRFPVLQNLPLLVLAAVSRVIPIQPAELAEILRAGGTTAGQFWHFLEETDFLFVEREPGAHAKFPKWKAGRNQLNQK